MYGAFFMCELTLMMVLEERMTSGCVEIERLDRVERRFFFDFLEKIAIFGNFLVTIFIFVV